MHVWCLALSFEKEIGSSPRLLPNWIPAIHSDTTAAAARTMAAFITTSNNSMDEAMARALKALALDDEKKTENGDIVARQILDDMFEQVSAEKLQNLPLVETSQLENLQLYPHQKQGIAWLVHQEVSQELPGWYTVVKGAHGEPRYKCQVTRIHSKNKPRPIQGSILSDAMGLGKTVQTIGLMLACPGCTLIVSPVSVMANWKLQLEEYAPNLRVQLFYGPDRSSVLQQAPDQIDVLLTSYHQLVSEMKQMLEYKDMQDENKERLAMGRRRRYKLTPRTWIFDVDFFRLVLDEAHEIRNPQTWLFKACCQLQAEHKLCLTGTPFVNRPVDIGSLLTFLDAAPLSDPETFELYIVNPIRGLKEVGLARLRTIMAHVVLRRNKDTIESTLPDKTIHFVRVALAEGAHKDVLEVFFDTTRRCIIGLFELGSIGYKLGAIFGLLLRCRQAACDLRLVPAKRRLIVEAVAEDLKEIDDLTSPEGVALLEKLIGDLNNARYEEAEDAVSCSDSEGEYASCASEEEEEEESVASYESVNDDFDGPKCGNCDEVLNEDTAVIIGTCQHVFCEECLDPCSGQFCPECGEAYKMGNLSRNLSSTTPMKAKTPMKKTRRPKYVEEEKVLDFDEDTERSPKVQALLDAIDKMMAPDEKGVIFSQWTSFLDIIQDELEAVGHTFTRIDGSMNAEKRLEAIRKFSTDQCNSMKTPRFVLCSLRACGTGINLTRGSFAFLMDPYWNLAVEDQAMDRIHRLGQTRPVNVVRFVMKDSIEEKMVDLQNAKAALGKGSIEKITQKERRKARLTFLRDMFNIGDQDVKWDTDLIDDSFIEDDDDFWHTRDDDEPWI